jgi:hypothetical protein
MGSIAKRQRFRSPALTLIDSAWIYLDNACVRRAITGCSGIRFLVQVLVRLKRCGRQRVSAKFSVLPGLTPYAFLNIVEAAPSH